MKISNSKLQTPNLILKFCCLVFGVSMIFGFWSLNFAAVSAATNDKLFGACTGKAAQSPVCRDRNKKDNPVVKAINLTASIIATLAGIAAVIMLMVGGFNFITSGGATPGQRAGDPNKVATARKQIFYALIGIAVIALAWTLTRFITSRVIQ